MRVHVPWVHVIYMRISHTLTKKESFRKKRGRTLVGQSERKEARNIGARDRAIGVMV